MLDVSMRLNVDVWMQVRESARPKVIAVSEKFAERLE